MKKLIILLCMLACMFLLSPLANAATLTFDGLSGYIGESYTEDGFTLTADPEDGYSSEFYAVVASDLEFGYYYSGSEALINDWSTATTLVSADGSLFNLTSIDLAEALTEEYLFPETISLTAVYADGSVYTTTLTTDGVSGFQTFTFGEKFQDLASVSFGYDSYFQFDNITANPVPVPSSLLLLGSGIAFLAVGRRGKN